jgi:hypothetical protein
MNSSTQASCGSGGGASSSASTKQQLSSSQQRMGKKKKRVRKRDVLWSLITKGTLKPSSPKSHYKRAPPPRRGAADGTGAAATEAGADVGIGAVADVSVNEKKAVSSDDDDDDDDDDSKKSSDDKVGDDDDESDDEYGSGDEDESGDDGDDEDNDDKARVFHIGHCPHEWLFSKVCAVVHHGGAGTVAAGLRAGKPTGVVPFFGDQVLHQILRQLACVEL